MVASLYASQFLSLSFKPQINRILSSPLLAWQSSGSTEIGRFKQFEFIDISRIDRVDHEIWLAVSSCSVVIIIIIIKLNIIAIFAGFHSWTGRSLWHRLSIMRLVGVAIAFSVANVDVAVGCRCACRTVISTCIGRPCPIPQWMYACKHPYHKACRNSYSIFGFF